MMVKIKQKISNTKYVRETAKRGFLFFGSMEPIYWLLIQGGPEQETVDNVRPVNLPVRVSTVLPTRVPVSDDSDVLSRFSKKAPYSSPSTNLKVWLEWLTKELPSPDDEGCGWHCGRGLWGNVNSRWGVWPYVSIIVLRAFWRTGSVIAFTSTP